MTRIRSFATGCIATGRSATVAFSLALGLAAAIVVSSPPAAYAADAKTDQKEQKVGAKVGKPLKAAQEAMQAKDWPTALAKIKEAQAVEKKTPFEEYQIDEFLGYIHIQQKQYSDAAMVFERMLNSGQVPEDQVDERTKTVAQLYFQVKDYRKAADWAKKWVDKNPDQEDMSLLLGQAYYLLNDYKNSVAVMSGIINNAERAGRKPDENWLEILLSSEFKLDNKEGVAEALKKSVHHYPKPERWENLLDIYARAADRSDRVTLGFYRLMADVNVMKRAGDYMEMAQLALEAGVPGEAEQILEKGKAGGLLEGVDKTEQGRYDRLLASAKKQAAADRAALPSLAKEAEKAPKGQADVALGQAYLSYGQFEEAVAALQRGIKKKEGVTDPDEAQVSLGIALMKKGDMDQARQAFSAVKDDSKWGDLADLWELRT